MVLLCFVLDLRTISPPLFGDLKQLNFQFRLNFSVSISIVNLVSAKFLRELSTQIDLMCFVVLYQSLLQLANFYAISTSICQRSRSKPLRDRIGLCCILKNRISCAIETRVAYSPRGNFSLRDFHHAVNNLPSDAFSPEFRDSGAFCYEDLQLENILSDKVLYSWGDHDKDVGRKVIFISSCLIEYSDTLTKKTLMDAADRCVSVDFILLEQMSSHLSDFPESVKNFVKNICDLENCSFRNYLPDNNAKVLCALVKQWLQDLKDETEEHLQARFIFQHNLAGTMGQICCNLFISFTPITDEFIPCQTCRCHGFRLDDEHGKKTKSSSCPVTGSHLEEVDLNELSLKVGEQTVLFMPSFHSMVKLHHVSSAIDFNVIERTNLGSLSEGLIVGPPYVVSPSTFHDSDDTDRAELNNQFLQGLSTALHSLDQGLVCSSNINLETMRVTSFQCYYILLPSDTGLMLLKRLAGAEEVITVQDVSHLMESSASTEIRDSFQAFFLEMEVRDYDPILHERGFHQKLNSLVKESLQFGSLPPKLKEFHHEPIPTQGDSLKDTSTPKQNVDAVVEEEEITELGLKSGHDEIAARITEEWEGLIANEMPKITSPTCIPRSKVDLLVVSPPENHRQLDEKTSRILERLEVPRQLKAKNSLIITSSSTPVNGSMLTRKPLTTFEPVRVPKHSSVTSQPMKPSFQRLKRKQR